MEDLELKLVHRFQSRLEAEAVGAALEGQGIPCLIKSEDLGVFGPGHSGATPFGATLWVPEEYFPEVVRLFTCFFPESENEEDGIDETTPDESEGD